MNAAPETSGMPPRYIVGIDLGTTNCAVAYVDTKGDGRWVADFPVDQFTAAGIREKRDALPSFLYALTAEESTDADRLVDPSFRVGAHARDHGSLTPGRMIASAKSWLCHAGVDRQSAILPWHAAEDITPISPVEAQAILLKHIRDAWDREHPGHPLAEQDVHITVPASFDEGARELTVAAARQAGIPKLILLEEPQAAFYAWLSHHEKNWTEHIAPDDHILVCDIGGGTTDLTLIHARPGDDGSVAFHRTAVGDHLILGGDNLDLALAHYLEKKLDPGKLDAPSWTTLVRLCRHYKETLLSDHAPDRMEVVLPGRGAGLLRNQRQTSLTRAEVEQLLLDGFLPAVAWTATPARRSSGFQEFGLPFAADAAITRYLAEFLRANLPRRPDGSSVPPQAILLNGGLFESTAMRRRFLEALSGWFGESSQPSRLLDHRRLDLAVARGAAYFGLVRRGRGVQVVSNLARSYYIGVESASGEDSPRIMCIAPASLSTGHPVRMDGHPLQVRLKTPVEFPLYVSSRRTTDAAGELVALDRESFTALPPLRTVLTAGKQATQDVIDVHLTAALTELGTLDLGIVEATGNRSWKLAFDLRAATQTDRTFHDGAGERSGMVEAERIARAIARLPDYFRLPATQVSARSVIQDLEEILELPRIEWPVSVLRALWGALRESADARKTSAPHEQRWLNLLGYCLRPGFGFALDDWRITETWKWYHLGPVNRSNEAVRAEWWILWRRVAGGLTTGQQTALATPILAGLKSLFSGKPRARLPGGWDIAFGDHETVELLRLVSLLERLTRAQRQTVGQWILERLTQKGVGADRGAGLWALGRIGARTPLYGPINHVITPEVAADWLKTLLGLSGGGRDQAFTLMSLARCTQDRHRDIEGVTREAVVKHLVKTAAPQHWVKLVEEGGYLEGEEASQAFGDSLPYGLMLNTP